MFSAINDNSKPPQHWLYDSSDILVELRVKPAQPYMNTGMAILQMAYILSGKEMPHKSELYLELWHAFLEDNIDRMLVTNRRLESQQQVFDALLYHTVLPCLDPEYAAANNYRPYNAMIFGPKGVGKTMIADMLAMTRFPYGVVVPISQSLLINDDVGLFPLIKLHREKYGVRFVPIIEDLDKLSSIPATGNAWIGALNSNLANLLAVWALNSRR